MLGARVDFGIRPRAGLGVAEGGKRLQDREIQVGRRAEISIQTPLARVLAEIDELRAGVVGKAQAARVHARPRDRVSP